MRAITAVGIAKDIGEIAEIGCRALHRQVDDARRRRKAVIERRCPLEHFDAILVLERKGGRRQHVERAVETEVGLRVHRDAADRQIVVRSEEHTSELQSLMRISYAVFCLKKNKVILSTNENNVKTYIYIHITH